MLAYLKKLEEEWSEINQYQKLSDIVQVWDFHVEDLEQACACAIEESFQLGLAHCMEMLVLKACFQAGQAELRMAVVQLKERMGVMENSLLASCYRASSCTAISLNSC